MDIGSDTIQLSNVEQVRVGGQDIYLDGRNNAMIWTGQGNFDLVEDQASVFADSRVTDIVWDFNVQVLGTQSPDVVAIAGDYISGEATGSRFSLQGAANYFGNTQVRFQVSDGVETSAMSGDFAVAVEGVNDAPVITGVVYTDGTFDTNGVQGYLQVIEYDITEFSYSSVEFIARDPSNVASDPFSVGGDLTRSSRVYVRNGYKTWYEENGGPLPFDKATAVALVEQELGIAPPAVIDLDGDGIELLSRMESQAVFDIDGDGRREAMSWVAPDDGFLAYDANGDGRIDSADEIRFDRYHPDAHTDMEGLRLAFNSNGDGRLTDTDEAWDKFGVFQDLNGDGFCGPEEFKMLSDWGIRAIDLTPNGDLVFTDDYAVLGTSEVTFENGSTTRAGDVLLRYQDARPDDVPEELDVISTVQPYASTLERFAPTSTAPIMELRPNAMNPNAMNPNAINPGRTDPAEGAHLSSEQPYGGASALDDESFAVVDQVAAILTDTWLAEAAASGLLVSPVRLPFAELLADDPTADEQHGFWG